MEHITKQEYLSLIKKKPKYHNKTGEFKMQKYASKIEAKYIQDIDTAYKGKAIRDYKTQVPFDLVVNGIKICRYVADAVVTHNNGSIEVIDVKGMETRVFQIKWRLLQALYPTYTYTLLK